MHIPACTCCLQVRVMYADRALTLLHAGILGMIGASLMLYRCHRSFKIKLAVVVTVRSQVKLSCQCPSLIRSSVQTFRRIHLLTARDLRVMQCRRYRHWHASAWLCLQQQPWSSFTSLLSCAAAQRRTVGAIASSSTSRKRLASCCQPLLAYPCHMLLQWKCSSWELQCCPSC